MVNISGALGHGMTPTKNRFSGRNLSSKGRLRQYRKIAPDERDFPVQSVSLLISNCAVNHLMLTCYFIGVRIEPINVKAKDKFASGIAEIPKRFPYRTVPDTFHFPLRRNMIVALVKVVLSTGPS